MYLQRANEFVSLVASKEHIDRLTLKQFEQDNSEPSRIKDRLCFILVPSTEMEEITRVVQHCVSVIVLGVQVNYSWEIISFGKRAVSAVRWHDARDQEFTFQIQETGEHDL
jgi:hypothetical protein